MKLSDIKGDRLFDLMAEITEPLCEIASDDALMQGIGADSEQGEGTRAYAIRKVRSIVPRLMKDHRQSLVRVLAALKGVTPCEYLEGLTLASLLEDVYDMLNDEDLPSFLS